MRCEMLHTGRAHTLSLQCSAVLWLLVLASPLPTRGAGQWGTVSSLSTMSPSIVSLPDLNRTLQFGGLGQEPEITQLYVFSDNLWSAPSVSGAPPSRGGGATWVSGGVAYVHGGRESCGREERPRTSDVGWINAETMVWGGHAVTPASDAASVAASTLLVSSIARMQHCALPLDDDANTVLLFGGQSRDIMHYWLLDTRSWVAKFVPISGDIHLNNHATHCFRSRDLVYFTKLFIGAESYVDRTSLGCFNLTSREHVLSPEDPPFAVPGHELQGTAPESGFVIQLNATSVLIGGGCDKTDDAACEQFRNTTFVVHGLDNPSQLLWVPVGLRNRGPLPAGLFSSASFRPQGVADREGPLSVLYADEPVGWTFPGLRKHVLLSGPLYSVKMIHESMFTVEPVPVQSHSLPVAAWGSAAATLPSGDVLVHGGCPDPLLRFSQIHFCEAPIDAATVYSPSTGTLRPLVAGVAPDTAALLQPGETLPPKAYFHSLVVWRRWVILTGGLTSFSAESFATMPYSMVGMTSLGIIVLNLDTNLWSILTSCDTTATGPLLPTQCRYMWPRFEFFMTLGVDALALSDDPGTPDPDLVQLVTFSGVRLTQSHIMLLLQSKGLSVVLRNMQLVTWLDVNLVAHTVMPVRTILKPPHELDWPLARVRFAFVKASATQAYVFGGGNYQQHQSFNDLWLWDMGTKQWSAVANGTECTDAGSKSSPVSGVAFGAMVGKSLLVVGTPPGLTLEVNQSVVYDPDVREWSMLDVDGSHQARFLPAVAFAGGTAFLFGGVQFTEDQHIFYPDASIAVLQSGVYALEVSGSAGDDLRCQLNPALHACASLAGALAVLGTPDNVVLPRSQARSRILLHADAVTFPDYARLWSEVDTLSISVPITISGASGGPSVAIRCNRVQDCGRAANPAPCISVTTGSTLPVRFEHVTIVDSCGNSAISVRDSSLTLSDVQLLRNVAPAGPAIHGQDSHITCTDVIAKGNAASSDSGGAMWASGCDIHLFHTVMSGNSARVFGGAVMLEFSALLTDGVEFRDNWVAATELSNVAGGALYVVGQRTLQVTNTVFSNNSVAAPSPATALGGGMYALSSSPYIVSTRFELNQAGSGGGAFFADETSPVLANVSFVNNAAGMSGGGGVACVLCRAMVVQRCMFLANVATHGSGGAVKVENVLAAAGNGRGLLHTQFTGNVAERGNGGAVFVLGAVVNVTGSMYKGNAARSGGGGAVFWDEASTAPVGMGDTNDGCPADCDSGANCAAYGCFVGTQGRKLSIQGADGHALALQSPPGSDLHPSITVELLDFYGQRVTSEFGVTVSVIDESADGLNALAGVVRVALVDGYARFTGLRLHRRPASTSTLRFEANGGAHQAQDVSISVQLSGCGPGQYLLVSAESGLASCQPCPKGTYQDNATSPHGQSQSCMACPGGHVALDAGRSECRACPAGERSTNPSVPCGRCPDKTWSRAGATECFRCPEPGARCSSGLLHLESDYWSADGTNVANVTPTTAFIRCPMDETCVATDDGSAMHCETGYTGPLCARCEDGFTLFNGACVECLPPVADAAIASLLACAMIAGMAFLVFRRREFQARSKAMGIARIGINFLQLNAALGSFRLHGSSVVRKFLSWSAVGNGMSLDMAPLRCLMGTSYYTQLLMYLCLPLILLGTTLALVGLRSCMLYARGTTGQRLNALPVFLSSSTVLLFLVHTAVSKASFSIWDVFPHRIYGRLYLAEDMSINAEDATYHVFQALSVASILVWTVGIPACAVVLLVRNRHALRTPTFQAQFGFMYDGYDVDRGLYWWEALVLLRKCMVVAIGSFVVSPFVQMLLATFLLAAAQSVHQTYRPYRSSVLNRLETASLLTSMAVSATALLHWQEPELADTVSVVVAALLVAVPVWLLVEAIRSRYHLRCCCESQARRHKRLSWPSNSTGTDSAPNPLFTATKPGASPSTMAARLQRARLGGTRNDARAPRSSRALRGRRASRMRGRPGSNPAANGTDRGARSVTGGGGGARTGSDDGVELTQVGAPSAEWA